LILFQRRWGTPALAVAGRGDRERGILEYWESILIKKLGTELGTEWQNTVKKGCTPWL
jgi:hypothetical protein